MSTTVKTISPGKLRSAKRAAIEACSRAHRPHPVKQNDGSTKHLCWPSRIGRAYDILAAEQDEEKVKLYRQAVKRLEEQALAQYAEADKAFAAYETMAQAVDVAVNLDDFFPVTCECEECVRIRSILDKNMEAKLNNG